MLFVKTKAYITKQQNKTKNPKPFLQTVANDFLNLAEDSFAKESSPEGKKWTPLKPATIKSSYKRKAYTKKGKKTK